MRWLQITWSLRAWHFRFQSGRVWKLASTTQSPDACSDSAASVALRCLRLCWRSTLAKNGELDFFFFFCLIFIFHFRCSPVSFSLPPGKAVIFGWYDHRFDRFVDWYEISEDFGRVFRLAEKKLIITVLCLLQNFDVVFLCLSGLYSNIFFLLL